MTRWLQLALAGAVITALALLLPLAPLRWSAAAETVTQLGGFQIEPAVDLLRRHGIVSGDPDGSLRLGATITRAELTKIAVTALGRADESQAAQREAAPFADVRGHWAQGHVAVARRLGIVGGYDDGSFRPNHPVTNAEAVTILLRTAGLRPTGPWPQAFLTAARTAGVLTPALERELPPGSAATRGAVFLLAERSFTRILDGSGKNTLQRAFPGQALQLAVTTPQVLAGITMLSEVNVVVSAPGAVMVQVNGRPVWPDSKGAYTQKVALQMGKNEILVLAVDEIGGRAEHRLAIERR